MTNKSELEIAIANLGNALADFKQMNVDLIEERKNRVSTPIKLVRCVSADGIGFMMPEDQLEPGDVVDIRTLSPEMKLKLNIEE